MVHAMKQTIINVKTQGREFYRIDSEIDAFVRASGIVSGLCHLFIQHTSASMLINENADPAVLADLETFMSDLVIDGDRKYTHTAEGPDDMAAHIRSMLTQTSLTIPIISSRLALGTWQGVYLWEHRYQPHVRKVVVSAHALDSDATDIFKTGSG